MLIMEDYYIWFTVAWKHLFYSRWHYGKKQSQLSFLFTNNVSRPNNLKTSTAMNAKISSLLFVLKRSYICYFIICMTVPFSIPIFLHGTLKDFNHNLFFLSSSIPQKAYKGYCQSGFPSTDYIRNNSKAPIRNLKTFKNL